MKLWFATVLFLISTPVLANTQKSAPVPPPFAQVKALLCTADSLDVVIGWPCGEKNFKPIPVDLNSDGNMEWIYLSDFCGASMNCSAIVIQKEGETWRPIWSGGGRSVWRLSSHHLGYADLVSYGHDSACVSVFSKEIWNGQQYYATKSAECDYCAQKKGKRQPAICNAKFKDALFCTTCEE